MNQRFLSLFRVGGKSNCADSGLKKKATQGKGVSLRRPLGRRNCEASLIHGTKRFADMGQKSREKEII
ncbi:MAG: hypothetical protein HKP10_03785 [Kiritimatiellales bacterium]|nr:hypothetical protein [Kiritimatiellales bacterium]